MLKSRNQQRKLTLGKETVRSLHDVELQDVQGGLPTGGSGEGGGSTVGNSRCNGCSFFSVSQC